MIFEYADQILKLTNLREVKSLENIIGFERDQPVQFVPGRSIHKTVGKDLNILANRNPLGLDLNVPCLPSSTTGVDDNSIADGDASCIISTDEVGIRRCVVVLG